MTLDLEGDNVFRSPWNLEQFGKTKLVGVANGIALLICYKDRPKTCICVCES